MTVLDARQTLTLEARHAVDAPFTDFDSWAWLLTPGNCTACGQDAYAGHSGWWHIDHQLCPNRNKLKPTFDPDP